MRGPCSWLLVAVLHGAAHGAPLEALAGELPKLDLWGVEEGRRYVSASSVSVHGTVMPSHRTTVNVQVLQELGENLVAIQFACTLATDADGNFGITMEPSGNWNPGATKVRVFMSNTPQVRQEIEFTVVDDGGPVRAVRPVQEPKSSGLVIKLPLEKPATYEVPASETLLIEGSLSPTAPEAGPIGPLLLAEVVHFRPTGERLIAQSRGGPSYVQKDGTCFYQFLLRAPAEPGVYGLRLLNPFGHKLAKEPFGPGEFPITLRVTESPAASK
jgi:hypothetical protein